VCEYSNVSEPEPPPSDGAEHLPSAGADARVDLSGLSRLSDRPPPPKGERTIRLVRGLSILLLALAAAGLPWYFVTRSGTKPGTSGTPTPSHSPSPSPSPSPKGTPATYEVFNLGTGCLHIRAQPSTSAKIVTSLCAGARVRADGLTRQVGSRLWRHVHYAPRNLTGWAAAEYLKLAT
jgi:SH3 domain-containing protein